MIETLRCEPARKADGGFSRLARHLDRAGRTCAVLRIPFDREACEAALRAALPQRPQGSLRCRLTIDRKGRPQAIAAALDPGPARWRVVVSASRLAAGDPWLTVKTTERRLYDRTRAGLPQGIDEVLFRNEAGEVCEGTITNVFARLDGQLVTPPLACGLLPGILREELLESGAAVERAFGLEELRKADAFFVGNSLRGLIPADFV